MKQTSLLMRPELTALTRAGTKTQTRRTNGLKEINEKPNTWKYLGPPEVSCLHVFQSISGPMFNKVIKCRYGRVGDLIYLKEPHYLWGGWYEDGLTRVRQRPKWRFKRDPEKPKWRFCKDKGGVRFLDSFPQSGVIQNPFDRKIGWHLRSPLFMSKADARTWLKITDISLDRIQNIGLNGCNREGVAPNFPGPLNELCYEFQCREYRKAFWLLWNLTNGQDSWDNNEWVWIIDYKLIDKPKAKE